MALSGVSGLSGMWGGVVYTYVLGPFRFATDQAAPLASPYTEAGAVGSLTVVDTGNKLSVGGGVLVAGSVTGVGDPGLRSTVTFARVVGRALTTRIVFTSGTPSSTEIGWSSSPSGEIITHAIQVTSAQWRIRGAASIQLTDAASLATAYDLLIVLRSAGAFYFINGGIFSAWTLLFVDTTPTTSPLYAGISSSGSQTPYTLDNLRVIDVGTYVAAFATDEGPATDRKASNSAGDTITMPADAWVEQTITAATGVDKDLYVRWTDDNNCWIVRQNQAGSTVKLIEKVAGVETSRMSAAQTFSNGTAYRMIAVCDGTTITVFVGTTKAGTYASATTNQTATTAKAPNAGTEFKSYKRFWTLPAGI